MAAETKGHSGRLTDRVMSSHAFRSARRYAAIQQKDAKMMQMKLELAASKDELQRWWDWWYASIGSDVSLPEPTFVEGQPWIRERPINVAPAEAPKVHTLVDKVFQQHNKSQAVRAALNIQRYYKAYLCREVRDPLSSETVPCGGLDIVLDDFEVQAIGAQPSCDLVVSTTKKGADLEYGLPTNIAEDEEAVSGAHKQSRWCCGDVHKAANDVLS